MKVIILGCNNCIIDSNDCKHYKVIQTELSDTKDKRLAKFKLNGLYVHVVCRHFEKKKNKIQKTVEKIGEVIEEMYSF